MKRDVIFFSWSINIKYGVETFKKRIKSKIIFYSIDQSGD